MTPWQEGALAGLSLIVAIGAQNVFVLRAGLRREHPFTVALVSALGDALLISLGAFGLGGAVGHSTALTWLATWGGAAFLAWFGVRALRAAWRGGAWTAPAGAPRSTAREAALAAAGFSLLNPHAYLDTVVVLGSLAARYPGAARAAFATGAMLASVLWFFGLAFGAARLAPVLGRPGVGRVLDACAAALMFALCARLLQGAGPGRPH